MKWSVWDEGDSLRARPRRGPWWPCSTAAAISAIWSGDVTETLEPDSRYGRSVMAA